MVTFCPYFAKRFGLHEAIIYQVATEDVKHSYDYSYGKYWISLNRFNWVHYFFFLKESEFEQAIENLVNYGIFEKRNDKYAIVCN